MTEDRHVIKPGWTQLNPVAFEPAVECEMLTQLARCRWRGHGGIQEIIEDYDPTNDTYGFLCYEYSTEAFGTLSRAREIFPTGDPGRH